MNLTLYGHSNHSFLYLQPPEEVEDQVGDDADQEEAFYWCLPLIPTSNSTNQSHCLLWLANQTVLTGTETERLPWQRADKGWCQDEGDVFLSSPCGNNERQGNKSGYFYFTSNSQSSLDSFLKSSVFPLPLHCLIFPRPNYILRLCISGIDFGYPSSCSAL
ncbi:hypothetical protein ILYODFUR_037738 [Ilyodon furcidens]|uniref:Uncharacterized protein n=1 Tax=Ilyodon furcidens TaxID=33524 RepID=A0ABV0V0A7_9TELE